MFLYEIELIYKEPDEAHHCYSRWQPEKSDDPQSAIVIMEVDNPTRIVNLDAQNGVIAIRLGFSAKKHAS